MHEDGDEEDLEEHELAKARKLYDEGVQEMPSDDDEKENEDDDVVSERESGRRHKLSLFGDFLLLLVRLGRDCCSAMQMRQESQVCDNYVDRVVPTHRCWPYPRIVV